MLGHFQNCCRRKSGANYVAPWNTASLAKEWTDSEQHPACLPACHLDRQAGHVVFTSNGMWNRLATALLALCCETRRDCRPAQWALTPRRARAFNTIEVDHTGMQARRAETTLAGSRQTPVGSRPQDSASREGAIQKTAMPRRCRPSGLYGARQRLCRPSGPTNSTSTPLVGKTGVVTC